VHLATHGSPRVSRSRPKNHSHAPFYLLSLNPPKLLAVVIHWNDALARRSCVRPDEIAYVIQQSVSLSEVAVTQKVDVETGTQIVSMLGARLEGVK
jgi:hypothetical protein